jgi:hypothetical protein
MSSEVPKSDRMPCGKAGRGLQAEAGDPAASAAASSGSTGRSASWPRSCSADNRRPGPAAGTRAAWASSRSAPGSSRARLGMLGARALRGSRAHTQEGGSPLCKRRSTHAGRRPTGKGGRRRAGQATRGACVAGRAGFPLAVAARAVVGRSCAGGPSLRPKEAATVTAKCRCRTSGPEGMRQPSSAAEGAGRRAFPPRCGGAR